MKWVLEVTAPNNGLSVVEIPWAKSVILLATVLLISVPLFVVQKLTKP